MNLTSQLTKLNDRVQELSANERAEHAFNLARQFEKIGEYESAYEALSEFWPDRNQPPQLDELDDSRKALILLRVGSLAGWLGSAHQIADSQETSKNYITNSIELFEKANSTRQVAEARGDLALCYWREGGYDEAKINLRNALALLGDDDRSDLKASLLIRAIIVEFHSQRLQEALQYCEKAAPIVDESKDHALKGSF